jgi:hypothetical protein
MGTDNDTDIGVKRHMYLVRANTSYNTYLFLELHHPVSEVKQAKTYFHIMH